MASFEFCNSVLLPGIVFLKISEDNIHIHSLFNCESDSRGRVFFLSAFLIEEDTELQRTAAISDHLIKTLTGFLVKNDLDDSSYALMREVSTLIYITLNLLPFKLKFIMLLMLSKFDGCYRYLTYDDLA